MAMASLDTNTCHFQ